MADLKLEQFKSAHILADVYDNQTISDIAVWEIKAGHLPAERDIDDPFYICDLGDVISKDNQWTKELPTIETYYAVKCNPDPVIIKLLIGLGRSFDCASKKEIQIVLDAGASPDRIIFAHPCKQESHLLYAKEKGVSLMTFDSVDELRKIKRVYQEAKLVLRMVYDDKTAVYQLGLKFGCQVDDSSGLMTLAKKLGMEIVGISFHIGSGSLTPSTFSGAISCAKYVLNIGTAIGHSMTLLDIGGGYPGSKNPEVRFEKFAEVIRETLRELFPPGCGVRVIAEPGTFYVQSAVHLVTNVIAKRDVEAHCLNSNTKGVGMSLSEIQKMYYLNTGLFNSFNALYTAPRFFKPPFPMRKLKDDEPLYRSCIWGPTCDPTDCLFSNCKLPELETGEFVIFQDMGAYTSGACSDFNGFGTPTTCYIAPREALSVLTEIF